MACFSNHENILNLFGYGWNTLASGYIPFLVTEFAEAGTLRAFLNRNQVSVYEKVLLTYDVAQGLHALHMCGIAHGDLKLDNVLVIPLQEVHGENDIEKKARPSRVKACISDFGHSLYLPSGGDDVSGWERYGGTLAYNAPEISTRNDIEGETLNFRKCNVWSLGLLAWETLRDGHPYYHHKKVQQAVSSHQSASLSSIKPTSYVTSTQTSQSTATLMPSQGSMATIVEELQATAPLLAGIACENMQELADVHLSRRAIETFCGTFQKTLSVSVEERVADFPSLPMLWTGGLWTTLDPKTSPSMLQPSESAWSFEVGFRKAWTYVYMLTCSDISTSAQIAV